LAGFRKGGEGGWSSCRADLDKSRPDQAVRRTDPTSKCRRTIHCRRRKVALLEKWVAMGAPFAPDAPSAHPDCGPRQIWFYSEDRTLLGVSTVGRPTPPSLPGTRWVRNEVDRFIAATHAAAGLAPAPEADRAEFARRLYFDLHGMPPTAAQLQAFVSDPRPMPTSGSSMSCSRARATASVGRNTGSIVVRYAESDGYKSDAYRPSAWPYRDYVIASLNADKPYDRFVREQLAGDELAPQDPASARRHRLSPRADLRIQPARCARPGRTSSSPISPTTPARPSSA
jgi:hypothetical protein